MGVSRWRGIRVCGEFPIVIIVYSDGAGGGVFAIEFGDSHFDVLDSEGLTFSSELVEDDGLLLLRNLCENEGGAFF